MYPWPASRISRSEMALLHQARQSSEPRVPITELIRRAVVNAYGRGAATAVAVRKDQEPLRKAA